MIGPTLGGRQGALVGQPLFPEPYNVTLWRAFDEAEGFFVDDVTASVTCSCPGWYSRPRAVLHMLHSAFSLSNISMQNYLRVLPRDARSAKRGIAIVSRPRVCPSVRP